MTFMTDNANIRQFQLTRFINENSSDEHVISKISIVLRRDKVEAPYYMSTTVRISTCIDMPEKGLIHAMDMLNHTRMHNLSEEKYGKIRALILDAAESGDEQADVMREDTRIKMVLVSKSGDEFQRLLKNYHELLEMIDGLAG
jgi:hypothetical protein